MPPAPQAHSRRARDVRSDHCLFAIHRALGYRAFAPEDFAPYGLTDAWAAGLLAQGERLWAEHGVRLCLDAQLRLHKRRRAELVERAEWLWRRLRKSAELSGLPGLISGRPPRALAALLDGLHALSERLGTPAIAERLAQNGYTPAQREELQTLHIALSASRAEEPALDWARQQASEALLATRAVILADLQRFARVAELVLLPGLSRPLRGERLLAG